MDIKIKCLVINDPNYSVHTYGVHCTCIILAYINVIVVSLILIIMVFIARQSIIYLNVIEVSRNPPTPLDFDVPLPVSAIDLLNEQWDLTTRQVSVFFILQYVILL